MSNLVKSTWFWSKFVLFALLFLLALGRFNYNILNPAILVNAQSAGTCQIDGPDEGCWSMDPNQLDASNLPQSTEVIMEAFPADGYSASQICQSATRELGTG